jgi:hypothetical protein
MIMMHAVINAASSMISMDNDHLNSGFYFKRFTMRGFS